MRNGCRSYNRHGPKFCGLASPRRAAVTEFWRLSRTGASRRTFGLIDILLIFQYSRPSCFRHETISTASMHLSVRDAAVPRERQRNTSVMCNNVRRPGVLRWHVPPDRVMRRDRKCALISTIGSHVSSALIANRDANFSALRILSSRANRNSL